MEPTQESTQDTQQQDASDEAAFEAGFGETRGDTAPTTAAPADTAAAPEKPASSAAAESPKKTEESSPAASDAAKPVEQASTETPPWKAAFDEVSKQLRQIHGHIGNLTAQQKDIRTAVEQAKTSTEAAGKAAPTQQEVAAAAASDAQWKQLREDYPDWAEAIDQRLALHKAELSKAAPPIDASEIEKKITADMQARLDKQRAQDICDRIEETHEGWQDLIKTAEFTAWEAKQTAETRALAASPKPKDAIRYIDLYKADLAKAKQKTEQDERLRRAATPSTVAVITPTEDPEAAFADGFDSVRAGGG